MPNIVSVISNDVFVIRSEKFSNPLRYLAGNLFNFMCADYMCKMTADFLKHYFQNFN